MDMVADIGTKRFMEPAMWLKVLYLINIVSPRFWTAKGLKASYSQQYEDGIPLKPGGFSDLQWHEMLLKELDRKRSNKSARANKRRVDQLSEQLD